MKKIGRGVGCIWYGIGSTGAPNPSSVFIEILDDATVNLWIGCVDIGQGSTTVMAQIAAEGLGIPYDDISVIAADSGTTPDSGITSASRLVAICGNAVKNAAENAKKEVAPVVASLLGVSEDELEFRDGEIYCKKDTSIKTTYKKAMQEMKKQGKMVAVSGYYNPSTYMDTATNTGVPYESYAYATAVAEVEVDTLTGIITLTKVVSAHDVGKAINKDAAEGQIEGGVVMGQGFALMENTAVKNGKVTSTSFSQYLIPTAMDAPEIYPVIVEVPSDFGPYGAKGLAEPSLIPTIPAIVDAVYNAIGIRFTDLPITPTDVLRELAKKAKEDKAV